MFIALCTAEPRIFIRRCEHHTALSIVPYFTALEFKTGLTGYDAGGYFLDEETVTFHHTRAEEGVAALGCGLRQDLGWKNWAHCTQLKYAGISYEEQAAMRGEVQVKRGKIPSLLDCYECREAKLYRKTATGLKLLLDCSAMQFEAVQAPYEGVRRENRASL